MKRLLTTWLKAGITTQVLAGVTLLSMFVITLAEVAMRAVWRPIPGTFELISLLGGAVAGLAVPHTSQTYGHITVDVLICMMPKKGQKIMNGITRLLVLLFFVFIAWSLISMGIDHSSSKEVTQTLRVPLYPVFFVLGGVFLMQATQFLLDILRIWGESDE
jgi:TRAP-type C4-dicarboxylate transport system permease small subunit